MSDLSNTINWSKVACRLKELRESRKLSHEKLVEELTKRYGGKKYKNDNKAESRISKQTLIDYEVNDENHSKAGKVKGMSIETLYMLADFYELPTDYILCKTDYTSPDMSMEHMCTTTGLNELSINKLLRLKHEYDYAVPWINDLLNAKVTTHNHNSNDFIDILKSLTIYQDLYFNEKLCKKKIDSELRKGLSQEEKLQLMKETSYNFEQFKNIRNGKEYMNVEVTAELARKAAKSHLTELFMEIVDSICEIKCINYKNNLYEVNKND